MFPVNDFRQTKGKVLNWLQQFNTFSFLDNHQYQIEPHTQECLIAAGVRDRFGHSGKGSLASLHDFTKQPKRWLFGHLGYDLKNDLEELSSSHPDHIGFEDVSFFEPMIVLRLSETSLIIEADDPAEVHLSIQHTSADILSQNDNSSSLSVQQKISRDEYLSVIKKLQQHILRGDCYEINFCQEFFAENAHIDPFRIYNNLSSISPNPFSGLYRQNDKWLLCASPERFIKKEGQKILSQPIKGTAKRVLTDKTADDQLKKDLFLNPKDRSENVMVVDLVRNDLAKLCEEGSVKVDELYGIYSFPQVHQMISTISGVLKPDTSFSDIVNATFPMGSMTGAPKKRVMQLIEQYEQTKRGIFSGAIGYISPDGDFDFNVVIRSIMYNSSSQYLSFQAGSAITFYADAEAEWEECVLKASAIRQALEKRD
ncbi:MAG: anthranilate synthase component I family protein [Chitinophagaceae bacterium]|nr:anthranilate synthase component I family protein [Chitinophagaceae bacterium]